MAAVKGVGCGGRRDGSGPKRVYRLIVDAGAGAILDYKIRDHAMVAAQALEALGHEVTVKYGTLARPKGVILQPESKWETVYPVKQ